MSTETTLIEPPPPQFRKPDVPPPTQPGGAAPPPPPPAPPPAEHRKPGDVPPPTLVRLIVGVFIAAVIVVAIAGILIARNQGIANADGFYGTRAKVLADVTITLEIFLFIGLTVGFFLARAGQISAHQYNQTFWTVFNVVLIEFVMVVSYQQQVVAVLRDDPVSIARPFHGLATLHMIVGGLTMLAAVFLIIRMNFRLPWKALRIKWWKNLMRLTLGGFYAAVALGLSTYFVWYIVPTQASGSPVAQEEGVTVIPLANFAFVPFEISVPLGTTIEWVNQDDAPHTVTYDDGSVDSGTLNKGDTFRVTYDKLGDFLYYCLFHGSPGIQGMAGVVHVVSAQEVAAAPTAQPAPTATPEATPAVAPIVQNLPPVVVGFLEFRDNRALNDEILLVAGDVAFPVGATLEFWLNGPRGLRSLGPIQVDASGNVNHKYTDPLLANLVNDYDSFFVSVEPLNDTDPNPAGQKVLEGYVPPVARSAVLPILVSSPVSPKGEALIVPFRFDAEDAVRHATSSVDAVNSGDLRSVTRHAEHIVNIIEGKTGPNYGDLDGNGTVFDPTDGVGLLTYARAIQDQARAVLNAPDASDPMKVHSQHVIDSTQNVFDWAAQADALALQLNATQDLAQAGNLASQVRQLMLQMRDGVDADGDGIVEPIPGEGGMWTAYLHAQYIVAMGVVPVQE